MRLWLDLETTGLEADEDHVLEVAWTLTDDNLAGDGVIHSHLVTPTNQSLTKLASARQVVRDMHEHTGLTAELLAASNGEANSVLLADLEQELVGELVAHSDVSGDWRLAGASVHFDLGFLRVHMPDLAGMLSHRVYDTTTLKAFATSIGIDIQTVNEMPHRAAWDVLECLSWAVSFRNAAAPAGKLDRLQNIAELNGAVGALKSYAQNLREMANPKDVVSIGGIRTALLRSAQRIGDQRDLALLHLDD